MERRCHTWAWEEFGSVQLGDRRLASRLLSLAGCVAQRPSGTISKVFRSGAERQAAYDLLSNGSVRCEQLVRSISEATARRCSGEAVVYVPIDGTSMTLSDPSKQKPLGSIGARRFPARGLKVMTSIALDSRGVPAGLVDVRFWKRGPKSNKSRFVRRRERDTEMKHLSDAIASTLDTLHDQPLWIVIDRGGDERVVLSQLSASGATFTVRASQNRVVDQRGKTRKLFGVAAAGKLLGVRALQLPATPTRAARTAVVEIRATKTMLMLASPTGKTRTPLEVGVVEVRERSNRRDRVRWILLTNHGVASLDDVDAVIRSYRLRWRIEEYHLAWKSGACRVEDIQLRSAEGIRKWATLLSAVAMRAERLKQLSRTDPDAPATVELSDVEIRALIAAKREIKRSTEQVPDGIPTIAQATLWIADIGGYAGHYKKGRQPGTITIARGLEDLAIWTASRIAFEAEQRKGRAK